MNPGTTWKRIDVGVQAARVSQNLINPRGETKVTQSLEFKPGIMNPTTRKALLSIASQCAVHALAETEYGEFLYLGVSYIADSESWYTERLQVRSGKGDTGEKYESDINEYSLRLSTESVGFAPFYTGDLSGITIEEGEEIIPPDGVAPIIISLIPADDSTQVSLTPTIQAIFNEKIKLGTGTIELRKTSDDSLVTSWDASDPTSVLLDQANNAITLPLSLTLDYSTDYYLLLPAGCVEDLAGNDFAGLLVKTDWNWVTIADPNTAPPILVSTLPVDDALTFDYVNVAAEMNFNINIKAGVGFIRIYEYDTDNLVAKLDVNGSPYVGFAGGPDVKLVLDTLLNPNTHYYILADTGSIENQQGIKWTSTLDDKDDWNFFTAAGIGVGPSPDIYFPPNISSNNDITLFPYIKFSENIFLGASGTINIIEYIDGTGLGGNDILAKAYDVTLAPGNGLVITNETVSFEGWSPEVGKAYYIEIPLGALLDSDSNTVAAHNLTGGLVWFWSYAAATVWSYSPVNLSTNILGVDPIIDNQYNAFTVWNDSLNPKFIEVYDYNTDVLIQRIPVPGLGANQNWQTGSSGFWIRNTPYQAGRRIYILHEEGILKGPYHGDDIPAITSKNDWNFTLDTPADIPTVTALTPANASIVDWSVDQKLTLRFDRYCLRNEHRTSLDYFIRIYDYDTDALVYEISVGDHYIVKRDSGEQFTGSLEWDITIQQRTLSNSKKYYLHIDSCAFRTRLGGCYAGIADKVTWVLEGNVYVSSGGFDSGFDSGFDIS